MLPYYSGMPHPPINNPFMPPLISSTTTNTLFKDLIQATTPDKRYTIIKTEQQSLGIDKEKTAFKIDLTVKNTAE